MTISQHPPRISGSDTDTRVAEPLRLTKGQRRAFWDVSAPGHGRFQLDRLRACARAHDGGATTARGHRAHRRQYRLVRADQLRDISPRLGLLGDMGTDRRPLRTHASHDRLHRHLRGLHRTGRHRHQHVGMGRLPLPGRHRRRRRMGHGRHVVGRSTTRAGAGPVRRCHALRRLRRRAREYSRCIWWPVLNSAGAACSSSADYPRWPCSSSAE